jgi:hypothetical protein
MPLLSIRKGGVNLYDELMKYFVYISPSLHESESWVFILKMWGLIHLIISIFLDEEKL